MKDNSIKVNGSVGGSLISGNVSGNVSSSVQGSISTNIENLDTSSTANEIQQILDSLSQAYSSSTFVEQAILVEKTVEQVKSNPELKARVIKALKAMGVETFMQLINHPAAHVLRAGLENFKD